MEVFGTKFWPDGVTLIAVGMLVGYLGGLLISRYLGGGKRVEEDLWKMRQEHERYREEVNQHFAKSADLLNNLTESYREVYRHMARSADKLCDDLPNDSLLEALPQSTPQARIGATAPEKLPGRQTAHGGDQPASIPRDYPDDTKSGAAVPRDEEEPENPPKIPGDQNSSSSKGS